VNILKNFVINLKWRHAVMGYMDVTFLIHPIFGILADALFVEPFENE
jgi:hypothetical protein